MGRARLDGLFVADGDVDAATALDYRATCRRGACATREAAPAKRAAARCARRVIGAAVQPPSGGRPLRNDREGAHA